MVQQVGAERLRRRAHCFYLMICIQVSTPSQVYPSDSWYGQPHCLKSVCLKGQSNELKNTICHPTKSQLSGTLFQLNLNSYSKTDITEVLHASTRIQAKIGRNRETKQFLTTVCRKSVVGLANRWPKSQPRYTSKPYLAQECWLISRQTKLPALQWEGVPTFKRSAATTGKNGILFWSLKNSWAHL